MDEGRIFGRGIAFPPQINAEGRVSWSQGPENIRESIRIILMTEIQERVMLPEFGGGLRSYLFEPNTTATHRVISERITNALSRWEPRIRVEDVVVRENQENRDSAIVTVAYRLVVNGAGERVSLAIDLGT